MTPELEAACRRAIHVLFPDGSLLRAGRGALHVLAEVGYPRTARLLGIPPLVWGVELGYWVVARQRGRFGRYLFRGQPDERVDTLAESRRAP